MKTEPEDKQDAVLAPSGVDGEAPLQKQDAPALACRHLRCKGMYITGESTPDPNTAPFDATVWWCTLTQKPLGPDDMPVSRDACRPGRRCCEPPDPA